MEENNHPQLITKYQVRIQEFSCIFIISTITFYSYAFSQISENLRNEILSILFLTYIILYFISTVCNSFIQMRIHQKLVGQYVAPRLLRQMNPLNRRPICWLITLIQVTLMGINIYIISNFLPISDNNCGIFYDNILVCNAFQVITILSLFGFAMGSLVLLSGLIMLIVFCVQYRRQRNNMLHARAIINNLMRKIVPNLPITDEAPDDVCSICLEKDTANTWKVLPCKHKFHPVCIDPWLLQSDKCPMCKKTVMIPNIASEHV